MNALTPAEKINDPTMTNIKSLINLFYAFHLSPAITNFVVNAVLIAVGYKFLSKRSMYLTTILWLNL
jgi:uncharacterized membrane-anchored protein YitT (DUF2179 family)